MKQVRIVADSTCDLSKEILEKYNIVRIPLCIVMDEVSYYDGENVTPDEIFAWSSEHKKTPKTAAITFERTAEALKPLIEENSAIVFIGLSEQMSVTCNVMRLMREDLEYEDIYSIDSRNLSVGIGGLVMWAAELVEEGKSAPEIVAEIEGMRERVRTSFLVDTLTFLARGGRCKAVTALLANTLQLKPKIVVTDGAMGVAKKYRGNINSSIIKYAKDLEPELLKADKRRVFLGHSGCSEELIQKIYDYLKELNHFDEIIISRVGCVISSHCGPNTLGIVFLAEKE